jgi:hypothetical protein
LGNVSINGKNVYLYAEKCFDMHLSSGVTEFSFNDDEIKFKNTGNYNPETYNKEIIIPYDTDLGNIESRLSDVEDIDSIISNIHSSNPYVGLDPPRIVSPQQTNLSGNIGDGTFFEYYKLEINNIIEKFGVLVKAKGLIDNGNMFMTYKSTGIMETGSDNLIGDLYLTNDTEILQVVCEKMKFKL